MSEIGKETWNGKLISSMTISELKKVLIAVSTGGHLQIKSGFRTVEEDPPHAPSGYCSKCSSSSVLISHVNRDELISSSSHVPVEDEFVSSSEYDYYFKLTAKKEHLLVTCNRCQYKWRTNVSIKGD